MLQHVSQAFVKLFQLRAHNARSRFAREAKAHHAHGQLDLELAAVGLGGNAALG
jgi:hypothetical protein